MPGGSARRACRGGNPGSYIPGMKNIGNVICKNGPPAVRVYRVKTFVHYTRYRAETPGRSVELPRVFLSRFAIVHGHHHCSGFEIAFYQSRKAAITIKYRGICHPLFTPFHQFVHFQFGNGGKLFFHAGVEFFIVLPVINTLPAIIAKDRTTNATISPNDLVFSLFTEGAFSFRVGRDLFVHTI